MRLDSTYFKSSTGMLLVLSFFFNLSSFSQNAALGSWTAQVPMKNATSICQSRDYIYAACTYGVLSVSLESNLLERYTKVSGLAEGLVTQVGYDTATSSLVVVYANANIDIIHDGKITNLPYLKNAAIAGDKNVYCIFCVNGKAYLGTGFGVLLVDLRRLEIADTYIFNQGVSSLRVNAIWADTTVIYCATTNGVVMGSISPNVNLLNFNEWVKYSSGIPQAEASAIVQYQNKIIAAAGDVLYQFDGNSWSVFFTDIGWKTMHLNNAFGGLQIAQQKEVSGNIVDKRIGKWNGTGFTFSSGVYQIERPMQLLLDKNGDLWHADLFRGLVHQRGGNFEIIAPNAPTAISSKEMDYINGSMYIASSDIRNNWSPVFNKNGIYKCSDYNWENFDIYNTPLLDSFFDIAVVKAIPDQNKLLFGTQTGIIEWNLSDNTYAINKFRPNAVSASERVFRITGADKDADDNVWMSDAYSNVPVVCRKADGNYVYFNSGFLNGKLVKDIVVDDYNQIWLAKEDAGGGLAILNYNNTIDDPSDDSYYNLAAGRGYGNLPANVVNCLAKDKDGVIWLGTSRGIAIISCAGYVTENACEAEQICIDRKDGSGFCDNLLEDEIINCITVDAANRKWIGTNNGLFLVSADGQKTIHYFNEVNSPLLANYVRSVAVNPDNGDVFIGTEKGICTFRAEATSKTENTSDPYVYPNPVREDYDGPIAINGIPENCNVKIVDISGNLVYETTATGAQAVWDGRLVNGNRAATGVYFALCAGADKKQKAKLKFLIIH